MYTLFIIFGISFTFHYELIITIETANKIHDMLDLHFTMN